MSDEGRGRHVPSRGCWSALLDCFFGPSKLSSDSLPRRSSSCEPLLRTLLLPAETPSSSSSSSSRPPYPDPLRLPSPSPYPPSYPSPIPSAELLCDRCKSISLNGILHGERDVHHEIYIVRGSKCHLCQFFTAVIGYSLDKGSSGTNRLPPMDSSWYSLSGSIAWTRDIDNQSLVTLFADFRKQNDFYANGILECNLVPLPNTEYQGMRMRHGRLIEAEGGDFGRFRRWIDFCCSHHLDQRCRPLGRNLDIPGFKVIDCETRHVIRAKIGCKFVALSYVWGPNAEEPVAISPAGALPDAVPRTIDDAIKATRKLGLRYLWVDQYCIDQADNAHKQQQISVMDMIYSLAFVTIIAACG
ncbi:heterokaryon incompatibility protein-domain-containing protein [Cladorrhinum sp. PSN332]|nr:heterokaryon incompatibility protein-domain-containing protein [Cladorrhinum sp. PSN332]